MNVAKWLLLAFLLLPIAELVAFIAAAAAYGFFVALVLVLAGMFAGGLVLRYAGSNHVARVRTAMGQTSFTALRADSQGGLLLLAGILLLIPGLITDFLGLLLLAVGLWSRLGKALGRTTPAPDTEGVVDLEPEQWHRVDDSALPGKGDHEPPGRPGNKPER